MLNCDDSGFKPAFKSEQLLFNIKSEQFADKINIPKKTKLTNYLTRPACTCVMEYILKLI